MCTHVYMHRSICVYLYVHVRICVCISMYAQVSTLSDRPQTVTSFFPISIPLTNSFCCLMAQARTLSTIMNR